MKIWIINHYALPPSLGGLNRHYYFSKYMQQMGHTVKIFSASQIHNSNANMIEDNKIFSEQFIDGIEYTFVRTSPYKGNGFSRIKNMLEFPLRVWKVCKYFEKPDVIYTSSPSLFAAASALLFAKRNKLPCVVEIRDLWPESIVEYQGLSRKNLVIQAMYQLEKWIYKKADRLVFTMEGGADYIKDKGWDKQVDLSKIYNINNGVDSEEFDRNRQEYQLKDVDLDDNSSFKVVYVGSIRLVYNLKKIVEAAKLLDNQTNNVIILIFGDGDERAILEQAVKDQQIRNVLFKGRVDKKYIPYILSKSDVTLMHWQQTNIMKYGCSANKQFEYFAAGKPVLSDLACNYNLIETYDCGVVINEQTPKAIADAIMKMASLPRGIYDMCCKNARRAAEDYDYKLLTDKLNSVFEGVINT